MKRTEAKLICAALVLAGFLGAGSARAQSLPAGTVGAATNLSSVMYYGPPNEQAIKMRLTGAEMSQLPDGTYTVKKLKIENYLVDGKLEGVAEAPQCYYAPLDDIASSPGHLELTLRDGIIRTKSEGFMWRQNESSLYFSNKVVTVIKMLWY